MSASADPVEPLRGVRVLVIDDDPDTLDMVTVSLSRMGASVWGAATGQAAVELYYSHYPNVVVSDLMLPEVDGYALVRYLRRFGMDVPAIAISGLTSPDDRFRSAQAGFDIHLDKPLSPDVLMRAILDLVAKDAPSA